MHVRFEVLFTFRVVLLLFVSSLLKKVKYSESKGLLLV